MKSTDKCSGKRESTALLLLLVTLARRAVAGALGAGAVVSAMFATAPTAAADPPNCTAADLAGVAAGVSAATSAYLFTHPEVNAFLTGLKGQPRDGVRAQVQRYLDAHPQTKAEIQAIRQPLVDIRNRGRRRRRRPDVLTHLESAQVPNQRDLGRCVPNPKQPCRIWRTR